MGICKFIHCLYVYLFGPQAELVCVVLKDCGIKNIVPQKLHHGYTLSKCKKSNNSEFT